MDENSGNVRWAVLGTGFISHTVVDAIALSAGSEVTVVAGRNADRVEEFCRQHSIPRSSIRFDDVFNDPNVDVVYVGLPNHMHHSVVGAAAAAGKAVLSEKSLTTTMADAHKLVAAVREHGTFFVEGLMYLAHPLYQRLSNILLDGRLGPIRSVRGSYAANIAHLVNPDGGGTIYNLGCYPVSLLHFVMQTVFGEDAFGDRRMTGLGGTSSDDGNVVEAGLLIRFDNGVLASLHSTDSYGIGSEFSISGDNGTLRFVTNPWLPAVGLNQLEWQPFEGENETILIEDSHDAFYHQITMVERCIVAGRVEAERPSPRLKDSLEIMEVLTAWEALCQPSD